MEEGGRRTKGGGWQEDDMRPSADDSSLPSLSLSYVSATRLSLTSAFHTWCDHAIRYRVINRTVVCNYPIRSMWSEASHT